MKYIIRLGVIGACLYGASLVFSDFSISFHDTRNVNDWITLGILAIGLLLIYEIIMPILRIVAFPINFITLGIFSSVLNIAVLYGYDMMMSSITIGSYLTLIIFSICLSFIYGFFKLIT